MASLPELRPALVGAGASRRASASYLYKSADGPVPQPGDAARVHPRLDVQADHRPRRAEGRVRHARRLATHAMRRTPIRVTRPEPSSTTGRPSNLGTMSLAKAIQLSCDTVFDRFGSDFYFHYVQNQLADNGLLLQNDLRAVRLRRADGRSTCRRRPPAWSRIAAWAKTQPDPVPGRLGPRRRHPDDDRLHLRHGDAPPARAGVLGDRQWRAPVPTPRGRSRWSRPMERVVKRPEAHCSRTLPYTPSELAYIRGALRSVIASGTAAVRVQRVPDLPGVRSAGRPGRPSVRRTRTRRGSRRWPGRTRTRRSTS